MGTRSSRFLGRAGRISASAYRLARVRRLTTAGLDLGSGRLRRVRGRGARRARRGHSPRAAAGGDRAQLWRAGRGLPGREPARPGPGPGPVRGPIAEVTTRGQGAGDLPGRAEGPPDGPAERTP